MTESEASATSPVGPPRLWFGLLAGPIAWSLHLLVSYPLVPFICGTEWEFLLHVVTLFAALIALAGAVIAYRSRQALDDEDHEETPTRVWRRASFMALAGMLLSSFFLFVIIVEGIPNFLLDPCA